MIFFYNQNAASFSFLQSVASLLFRLIRCGVYHFKRFTSLDDKSEMAGYHSSSLASHRYIKKNGRSSFCFGICILSNLNGKLSSI